MATINGQTQKRTTLVADTEDEIQFANGIQKISIVATSTSMADTVYIKPIANLTGADAAAWANDTGALVLNPIVRSVELYFPGPVTSIFVGSAGAEEIQWYESF